MKTLQFKSMTMLVFLAFIVACSNENEKDENKIEVSALKVAVRENLEQIIEISGGTGTYSCEVVDNEIATAKISDHILIITGHRTGTTSVAIEDGANAPATITVKVLHQKILFEITELESKIEVGKNDFYHLIIDELQESFPFPVGAMYELIIKSEKTNLPSPVIIKGDLRVFYNSQNKSLYGAFELYGDRLTMLYSGQTYTYVIDANKEHWFLTEDLTEYYKQKYQEADINYIYNNQVLKLISGSL